MDFEFRCQGVLVHFPNKRIYSLFPNDEKSDVLCNLRELVQPELATSKNVAGTAFSCKFPACPNHVFVALPEPDFMGEVGMMDVYAVPLPDDGRQLTKNEVQNEFCMCFGSKLLEGKELTVEHCTEEDCK